jgi:hypothetical protein
LVATFFHFVYAKYQFYVSMQIIFQEHRFLLLMYHKVLHEIRLNKTIMT